MNVFDPYGPFVVYGTKLFNIFFLNILILGLTSLVLSVHIGFLVLVGIMFVCFYKVAYAGIAPHYGFGPSYFIKPFKQIKKRWGVLFIGSFINMFIIIASIYALFALFTGLLDMSFMIPVYALILIEGIIISFYALPLIAHTEMATAEVYKYAFAFAHKHLLFSLLLLLVTAGVVVAINYFWFLILLLPSALLGLISYIVTEKVFPKYDLEPFGLNLEA